MSPQPSARSSSAGADPEDRAAPPREFAGPLPNLLDENFVMAALNATFNFHMLTADGESKSLLYWALRPLVLAFNGLWDVLYRAIDGTTKLAVLVGDTFLKLWSLVFTPIWAKLWAALEAFYELAGAPLGTALQGLQYVVGNLLGPLVVWLEGIRVTVLGIPAALRLARTFVLQGAGAVESLVAFVEVRAKAAFGVLVSSYNEAVDWLNHALDPAGVFRETTFAWSVWSFAGDVIAALVNSLVPDDLDAQLAQLAEQWPILLGSVFLVDFQNGSPRNRAALDSALHRFRQGQL